MQPCPANAPAWMQWGWKEIGTHEVGDNGGPDVARYIRLGKCGALGQPWCAIFENAALESSGIQGTRSPGSQSFRNNPNFVKLGGPALGAIAVFWRGSRNSGLGHVGDYVGERGNFVWVLGGNEADMVQVEALPKNASTFGLVDYFWPRSLALPKIAPVILADAFPNHLVKVV